MNELYRLLIVDDEIILRNGVKYLCNWEGFRIQLVFDLEQTVSSLM